MDATKSQPPPDRAPGSAPDSLGSWKEIAAYLKRDERTVRRWEKQGLPVHRHIHNRQASVYAFRSELEAWWRRDSGAVEPEVAKKQRRAWWIVLAAVALPLLLLAIHLSGLQERLFGASRSGQNASIAVLPLRNLSADREQDYFADGITEALITQLGQISTLDVISHQSILAYRDAKKSLPQIARELNVKAVVEGTVFRSGDKVRITANLVQASPERHLWAESFEIEGRNILDMQAQVAREVAANIHARLTPMDRGRLNASRAVNPQAYEAFLLGRAYLYKTRTAPNSTRAKEYFEKAIALDPGFAPPYASMAELYIWSGGAGTLTTITAGVRDMHVLARQWAERALAIDDSVPEAHHALAMAKQTEWDWAGAEREYRRAIEINHSYAQAHLTYAMYLCGMQRFHEATAYARRAQLLDPAAPFINAWAGSVYFYSGREEDGMAAVQKALELEPGYSGARLVLGRNHVLKGRYKQAIATLESVPREDVTDRALFGVLAYAYARAGEREKALRLVQELKSHRIPHSFALAWAHAGLGEKDEAFAWLERCYEERRNRLTWLNVDPFLDSLRSDPRFADLVRRVGLPAAKRP